MCRAPRRLNYEEVCTLGAKSKLNAASFNGAVALAGMAGLLTGSWAVFLALLALLTAAAVAAGDIRS